MAANTRWSRDSTAAVRCAAIDACDKATSATRERAFSRIEAVASPVFTL